MMSRSLHTLRSSLDSLNNSHRLCLYSEPVFKYLFSFNPTDFRQAREVTPRQLSRCLWRRSLGIRLPWNRLVKSHVDEILYGVFENDLARLLSQHPQLSCSFEYKQGWVNDSVANSSKMNAYVPV